MVRRSRRRQGLTPQNTPATSQTPPKATANPAIPALSMENMEAATNELGNEVLSAIHSLRKDFSEKFEDVLAGIGGLKNELQAQANRITETEDRIGRAEDDLHAMHNTVKKLKEKCDMLESRVEEHENRGRRNNLRIIGIPKAEG